MKSLAGLSRKVDRVIDLDFRRKKTTHLQKVQEREGKFLYDTEKKLEKLAVLVQLVHERDG